MLSTQSVASAVGAEAAKRWPSSQSPVPARSARVPTLPPMPELADVQNGTTVLPAKSLASAKVLSGHAASPYQMG